MIYRRLDVNGDYIFGSNGNAYLSGTDAVRQAVLTRLRLLLYEWWEDLEDGLPLWQEIIAQRNIEKAKKLIQERIVKTPHVTALITFDATWENETRRLTVLAVIDTEYGQIDLNEVMT